MCISGLTAYKILLPTSVFETTSPIFLPDKKASAVKPVLSAYSPAELPSSIKVAAVPAPTAPAV